MDKSLRWKALLVLAVVLIAVYFLFPTYRTYFDLTEDQFAELSLEEQDELRSNSVALGLDLQGGMDLLLEVDVDKLKRENPEAETEGVMERALSVLRNRIDEFGVTEPVIQKAGDDRLIVQLPGLTDPRRARQIIERVANLEFRLVKEPQDVDRILKRVDRLAGLRVAGLGTDAPDSLAIDNPILSRYIPLSGTDIAFDVNDVSLIEEYLSMVGVDSVLTSAVLKWSKDDQLLQDGRSVRQLYVLDKKVQISGEGIKRAAVRMDPMSGSPEVELRMTSKAGVRFGRVTGNNVGRRLAIVLDDKVATAPVINSKIPSGIATIQGAFTDKEANDLRVVLEAGALPAPLKILEQRSVGPSLGADSIRQGFKAMLIGLSLVIVFMVIYYRASGFIAVLALMLNLLFLMAALAKLGATLTLPGIAGIVLTIGMAVDANVLIFERIREELKNGKTVRVAVDAGFDRALTAIFDANVTTLIAAIVLLQYGAGPIRGFAVTLAIGIVANLFTAYFVSRMVFELAAHRTGAAKLSI